MNIQELEVIIKENRDKYNQEVQNFYDINYLLI